MEITQPVEPSYSGPERRLWTCTVSLFLHSLLQLAQKTSFAFLNAEDILNFAISPLHKCSHASFERPRLRYDLRVKNEIFWLRASGCGSCGKPLGSEVSEYHRRVSGSRHNVGRQVLMGNRFLQNHHSQTLQQLQETPAGRSDSGIDFQH